MSVQPATDEQIASLEPPAASEWSSDGTVSIKLGVVRALIARIQVERENAIRECAAICADIYPYGDTYSDKILNMLPPKPSSQPSELIQRDIDSRRERIARKL